MLSNNDLPNLMAENDALRERIKQLNDALWQNIALRSRLEQTEKVIEAARDCTMGVQQGFVTLPPSADAMKRLDAALAALDLASKPTVGCATSCPCTDGTGDYCSHGPCDPDCGCGCEFSDSPAPQEGEDR